jgi:predicted tellurium resistance membrane protein TerC
MMEWFTTDGFIALIALTAMEIVLGIDNIVFVTILTGRLPPKQRPLGRRLGLALALATRILLLLAITWIMGLTTPLFTLFNREISWRGLILIGGGLFLIIKATREIYDKVEVAAAHDERSGGREGLLSVVAQIGVIDVVFSLDSVITAVGMVDHVVTMVIAVTIAMIVMILAINVVSGFVERHPSLKILALAFLLLIGVMLVAEGMGRHVEKGYIYAAMAFSLFIEGLNLRYRGQRRRLRTRRA